MTDSGTGRSTSRLKLGPILALVAAGVLALSTLSSAWWEAVPAQEAEGMSYRVGLYRAQLCRAGSCQSRPLSELAVEPTWGRTALAGMGGGIVSALLLVAVALTFGSRSWARHLGWVCAVMVLFTAAMIVIAHLRLPFDDVRPAWALIVGFIGLAAGLLATGLRLAGAATEAEAEA